MVRLSGIQSHTCRRMEGGVDVKTGRAEVVAGHRRAGSKWVIAIVWAIRQGNLKARLDQSTGAKARQGLQFFP